MKYLKQLSLYIEKSYLISSHAVRDLFMGEKTIGIWIAWPEVQNCPFADLQKAWEEDEYVSL